MDNVAIKVEHVDKSFKLPHEKHGSIKNAFINILRGRTTYEKQEVLKDINFEVKKGEFFGIVGRNGSGKSTLLKLLAGIYSPNSGAVQINGKLTPFIELGVGFNPELTGRENVFLNGALLGFSRKEMGAMYREIVDFAELEKFMDQKLKNYSSGMQVRLAFSVAIRAETDILLIDEVLAVGDQSFQDKCYRYFSEIKKTDKTVVFVTHDMGSVERFCDRVLLLDKSQSENGIYPVREAVVYYNRLNHQVKGGLAGKHRESSKRIFIEKVELLNGYGKSAVTFLQGSSLTIQTTIGVKKPKQKTSISLGLAIHDQDGYVLSGPNSLKENFTTDKRVIRYTIPALPFNMGEYNLTVDLYDEFARKQYDVIDKEISFFVNTEETTHGKFILDGVWKNH